MNGGAGGAADGVSSTAPHRTVVDDNEGKHVVEKRSDGDANRSYIISSSSRHWPGKLD